MYGRVYGNLPRTARPGWTAAFAAADLPAPKFVHQSGKNAADFVLTIEAVGLLHSARPDLVCLLSGDGGFAHVVRHLRRAGIVVHVFGGYQAAKSLRRAATEFHQIAPPRPALTRSGRDVVAPGP